MASRAVFWGFSKDAPSDRLGDAPCLELVLLLAKRLGPRLYSVGSVAGHPCTV